MNNDRDYIKDIFDSDGIRAPESLSEENVLKMLDAAENNSSENAEQTKQPDQKAFVKAAPKKSPRIRPENRKVLAAAAAVMIAVFGITALSPLVDTPPDTHTVNGELYAFRNASELRRTVNSLSSTQSGGLLRKFGKLGSTERIEEVEVLDYESNGTTGVMSDAAESSADSGMAKSSGQDNGSAHSDTYLQVEDVDEADIVKTDGKYIYYVNRAQEVVILEAKDGKTKKLATIGSSNIENYIEDIFLSGDTLVTVGRIYSSDEDNGASGIVIYDISDRNHPVTVSDYRQSGSIISSRMVGDIVYLVTEDYVYKGGRLVPICGPTDACSEMDISDIRCMPEPASSSYIVLSAVDTSSGAQGKASSKAVLGATNDIYCNDHALYTAAYEWDSESGTAYTRIAKASIDGLDIRFASTAKVRGNIINQFSMDESKGYFRIATTSERNGLDVNNIYVLDQDLRETGKVTGFARNESIKAVRFMGDKAYVITYQAIDPLFVIDMADPQAPRIEGEVMIDGFSTLLVPAGEGRLLGIGHATGDNGYGGEYASGLKLALFDISDPSEPKVLDSREFKDMSSPAQSDHHALTVNTAEGYFAIPYSIYYYPDDDVEDDVIITEDAEEGPAEDIYVEPEESKDEQGVLVFKTDDSISYVDQHRLGDSGQIMRSVYVGDYIYALDPMGNVQSFKPF